MLGTFLIVWRETVEAALVVGILLTYLTKIGQSHNYRYVYHGVLWGVLASLTFAYLSHFVAFLFRDGGEDIFNAAVLFLATGVLTHMVVWMHHHARAIKGELQGKVQAALETKRLWALATLAFIGVFREGIETVLFLWGLFLQVKTAIAPAWPLMGGLLGLGSGVIMAYLFFKGFGHLDLRLFFRVTGILLLIMSAGMLSAGIGKLVSGGVLPPIIQPIWNTSWFLDEHMFIGSLVAGLFGYRSRPSLLEAIFYFSYFPFVTLWLKLQRHDLSQ